MSDERSAEIARLFDAAVGAGMGHGLDVAGPGEFDEDSPPPPPPPDGEVDDKTLALCAELEMNDTDNGHRLLAHFGAELLHVREVGWHTYTGKVWRREGGDEAVQAYAQLTAKRIHLEADILEFLPFERDIVDKARPLRQRDAKTLTEAEEEIMAEAERLRQALGRRRVTRRKFATNSGNGGKVSAMVAQALPHKSVAPGELDADDLLFNCENVTLRFSKVEDHDNIGDHAPNYTLEVEGMPHSRADLITKIAPVVYDLTAKCPKWDAFLERFQPSVAMREYFQTYHGLALTGLTGHQCFIFHFGGGANGKSTATEALASVYGGYSDLLNAESVTGGGQRRGDQATPDIAEMPGVRYLRISELQRGEELKEALIKSLTGGEEIKARHLNKGFFKFTPKFKAVMSGNDRPKIGGIDNGIWRRTRLMPWRISIDKGEQRPMNEILAEFAAERSGILNWMIAGLDRYMREGLQTPEEVEEATAEYRGQMDPVGAFAGCCVVRDPDYSVTAREMYHRFLDYCEANSIHAWKETAFGLAMPTKGFEKDDGRVRRYKGVRLDMGDIPFVDRSRSPNGGGGFVS